MPNMRQTMKLYYEYGILIEVATNNSIAHSEPEQSFIHQSFFLLYFCEFFGRNSNHGDNGITTFFFCQYKFLLFAANIQTTVKSLPNTKMLNNRHKESVEFQIRDFSLSWCGENLMLVLFVCLSNYLTLCTRFKDFKINCTWWS